MHLILLGGNNKSNKKWIYDISKNLSDLFTETHVLNYSHWDTENKDIDFNYELNELKKLVNEINDTDYIIFAKSAGTILSLKAINEEIILPMACIFLGFAYSFAKNAGEDIDKWLLNYDVPTLFIQKENDPAYSAKNLKDLLKEKDTKNTTLEVIQGDDHNYEDIDLIHNLVMNYLSDDED